MSIKTIKCFVWEYKTFGLLCLLGQILVHAAGQLRIKARLFGAPPAPIIHLLHKIRSIFTHHHIITRQLSDPISLKSVDSS